MGGGFESQTSGCFESQTSKCRLPWFGAASRQGMACARWRRYWDLEISLGNRDGLDLPAFAAPREGFALFASDVSQMIHATFFTRPGDRSDLRADKPAPELTALNESGPALLDGRLPFVFRERLPDRSDFVCRVQIEVREPASQSRVGQGAHPPRGLGSLFSVDCQENEPRTFVDFGETAQQDHEGLGVHEVSACPRSKPDAFRRGAKARCQGVASRKTMFVLGSVSPTRGVGWISGRRPVFSRRPLLM
jgi:hypothetical protein